MSCTLAAIEQHTSGRDQLKQYVELGNVGGKHREAVLLRQEEQHAVVQRLEPGVPGVTLQAAKHA
jgi:hypothetical protein